MYGPFTQAALIFFREGLETVLLLGALAVYVERAGAVRMVSAIYIGALCAVVVVVAVAILLKQMSVFEMPAVEAATALFGATIMFYVSGWVWGRRHAGLWSHFLTERARRAVDLGRGLTVGALAFLITLREGAEIIIFASALSPGGRWEAQVLAGLTVGAAALTLVFLLVRGLSVRLPLRLFFALTSAGLFLIALLLVGEGVMGLQQAGVISANPLPRAGLFEAVGLNPTWEAVVTQIMIVALALTGFVALLRTRPT